MAPPEDRSDFDFAGEVDYPTFEQILDMDEDGEGEDSNEFSKSIVLGFLEQAETTFDDMEEALEASDLERLSSLGHFLKGSSATLGLIHLRDECEKIQHYGQQKDDTGTNSIDDKGKCLRLIGESLATARESYSNVKRLMRRYYGIED